MGRSCVSLVVALFALALPPASASAADPVVAHHHVLNGISALNGYMVYSRETAPGSPVCMRRVGGKALRASRLPLTACTKYSNMGLDSRGRVIVPFSLQRKKHGPLRWYAYDVMSDRVRPVRGLPGGGCTFGPLLIWRNLMVYSAGVCNSPGLWVKEGKRTRRILASADGVEDLALRGRALAGIVDAGPLDDTIEAAQLMVDGKPCVRGIESSLHTGDSELNSPGVWIANGNIVWGMGYGWTRKDSASLPAYKALLTSKLPSRCTAPGPNGRFDFTPETTWLRGFEVDGREVLYVGRHGIRSHTLAAQPSYAAPTNDDFENAQSVAVDGPQALGSTAWATTQPGEPLANESQTIWYTFTPAVSGTVYVSAGSAERFGAYGQFAVYTGTSLATLSPVGGPTGMGAGNIEVDAVAGQRYWVDVGNSDPQANYTPLGVGVATTP